MGDAASGDLNASYRRHCANRVTAARWQAVKDRRKGDFSAAVEKIVTLDKAGRLNSAPDAMRLGIKALAIGLFDSNDAPLDVRQIEICLWWIKRTSCAEDNLKGQATIREICVGDQGI